MSFLVEGNVIEKNSSGFINEYYCRKETGKKWVTNWKPLSNLLEKVFKIKMEFSDSIEYDVKIWLMRKPENGWKEYLNSRFKNGKPLEEANLNVWKTKCYPFPGFHLFSEGEKIDNYTFKKGDTKINVNPNSKKSSYFSIHGLKIIKYTSYDK